MRRTTIFFLSIFCGLTSYLFSQDNIDSTRKGYNKSQLRLFFKRNFDLKNRGSKKKYKNEEKYTDVISFSFENSEKYKLVFEDNFDSFNTVYWRIGQPWGDFHGQEAHQYYNNDTAVKISNGNLILYNLFSPRKFKIGDSFKSIPYAMGIINGYFGQSYQYGYFAIRSKNPTGPATWPAFWLTGKYNWPPEIDIFEMYGRCNGNSIHEQTMTLHFGKIENKTKSLLTKSFQLPNNTDTSFHIYACLWEPGKISFFTDAVLIKTITLDNWMQQFYNEPMYLVINNSIDKNYIRCLKPEHLPQSFVVDWVKVYQLKP